MRFILIDFGSTSIKYTTYNEVLNSFEMGGAFPFPDRLDNDNEHYYEVSVADITSILFQILSNLTCDIKGIFISVQMHGYILADEKNVMLTPYISWRDMRSDLVFGTSSYFKQLPFEIAPQSGTKIKSNLPVCSLYANQYLSPEIVNGSRTLYTLGSYLSFCLTDNNVTHITDAAATGFYDVSACERIVDAFGNVKIPKALKEVEVIGHYKNIPVYTPIGDHQATFSGSEVDGENQYLLNIGTAAQISTLSNEISGAYECRPYFYGKKLCTISGLIGGRHIQRTIRDNLYNEEFEWEVIENYREAIAKLPKKETIVVSGGAAAHYPELIQKVCRALKIPFEIRNSIDALNGLKKISEQTIRRTYE